MFKVCTVNKKKDVYDLPLDEFKKGDWIQNISVDGKLLDISYNLESQKLTIASREVKTVKEEIQNGNATNKSGDKA